MPMYWRPDNLPDRQFSSMLPRSKGPVLVAPRVVLIFWGGQWASIAGRIEASALTTAVHHIMESSYLSALNQYRGIVRGKFVESVTIVDSPPRIVRTTSIIIYCIPARRLRTPP